MLICGKGGKKRLKIKILDAMMGTGKTTAMIDFVNNEDDNAKFIYIVPFLTEADRIIKSCKIKHFVQPEARGNKISDIKRLIANGRNIVSTHALFRLFDEEVQESIRELGYTLIMDEVTEVVSNIDIKTEDIELIKNLASIDEGKAMQWTADNYDGRFRDIKNMCKRGGIGVTNDKLMWMLPPQLFEVFREVYVLTYMFEASMQKSYYDYFRIAYEYANYLLPQAEVVDYAKLIHIFDNDKMNAVGDEYYSLSVSWYGRERNISAVNDLRNNLRNYFINYMKSGSALNMWTTYEPYIDVLKGKGYTGGFVPCNARATNNYRDKTTLAYAINRFPDYFTTNFFNANSIKVDRDAFALSEMLQWIFRSAVRDGKEITVYVPSIRMRGLLENWLKGSE